MPQKACGSSLCGSGGIGRHTILRGWRREACGFESRLRHPDKLIKTRKLPPEWVALYQVCTKPGLSFGACCIFTAGTTNLADTKPAPTFAAGASSGCKALSTVVRF